MKHRKEQLVRNNQLYSTFQQVKDLTGTVCIETAAIRSELHI
jgi:hypothetical protein